MALIGTVGEFVDGSIHDYLDQLDFYLEANDIEDDNKKRAILLTVVGQKSFRLLKDLCQPTTPREKSFTELTNLLKNFYAPPPPKFLQRAKFDKRLRQPGESIQAYVAELRSIAEYCQFGDTLNDRLCERFVTGINSEAIQRKLLFERELTIDKAVEIALSHQQTAEGAQQLSASSSSPMNDLHFHKSSRQNWTSPQQHQRNTYQQNKSNSSKCYRCGGPHNHAQCKFRNERCHSCSKLGHISKMCKSSGKPPQGAVSQPRKPNKHRNHCLNDVTDNSESWNTTHGTSEEEYAMYNLDSGDLVNKPLHVNINVDNRNMEFQIDTGSSLTVVTKKFYDSTFGNTPLQQCYKLMNTYTGESVPIIGEKLVNIRYGDQQLNLPLIVVDGTGPPLLGRNWMSSLKINWNELFHPSYFSDEMSTMLERNYSDVFHSSGELRNFTAKINLKPEAHPIFLKARQPPYALREGIETELTRLQKEGIIKPVEFSDWATPIVPVLKKSGAVRICGDYKSTINKSAECDSHPIPRLEDLAQQLAGGQKFTKLDFTNAYT